GVAKYGLNAAVLAFILVDYLSTARRGAGSLAHPPPTHPPPPPPAGAHITSVLKDALSVPRPYSPPVTRLSVGTHAHEYGFPSTHSSNACSMALYFGGIAVERWTGHWGVTVAAVAFATFFAWSITFGRLYTGMHSISDVVAGSAIGSALWLLYTLTYTRMNALIQNSRWTGTLVSIPTLLVLVTVHPEPVEECPCFEDAVAFLSVVEGIFLREFWTPEGFPNKTYGHKWRTRAEVGMWFAAVLAKLVLGVSWILVWRIVSKRVCHLMLPPLFRFFSPLLQLPRRHYKPATEYDSYSPQESLSPVPSILDLPSLVEDSAVSPSIDRAAEAGSYLDVGKAPAGNGSLRNRANGAKGAAAGTGKKGAPQDAHDSGFSRRNSSGSSSSSSASSGSLPAAQPPKVRPPRASETAGTASAPHRAHRDGHGDESHEHKDADVLTKVITYVGIGYFASTGSQYVFQLLGWSVPA
ncbi:hypothetical protein JCM8202_005003, partial [Rhodotorula sphaerocarpa]